jgi:hypothetical protein
MFHSKARLSPADDVLALAVAAVFLRVLGWHLDSAQYRFSSGWELAVANVFRKWKQKSVGEESRDKPRAIEGKHKAS